MDATTQAYWTEFEKTLEIPQVFKDSQAEIIRASGWTEKDGTIPGVFANKRRGSRALWSCRWGTSHGVLDPNNWMSLETMTFDQLKAEMMDAIWSRPTDPIVGELTRLFLEQEEEHNPGFWHKRVKDILQQLRIGYPDYTCPWDIPSRDSQTFRLMRLAIRPGWGINADYGF